MCSLISAVVNHAAELFECEPQEVQIKSVLGGDINQCFQASSPEKNDLFIKTNADTAVLQSEYSALKELARLGAEAYPNVIHFSSNDTVALLTLEYISMSPLSELNAGAAASCLARQHQLSNGRFGWSSHGHIGRSKQINTWCDDWREFFTEWRLSPQLEWAIQNGLSAATASLVEKVIRLFPERVDTSAIVPALLHGDLWSGNIACRSANSRPCLFDPAPYFGDADVDIAMSTLFAKLPPSFYSVYRTHQPEPKDFGQRAAIYNLYHALNHFNLFGAGYEGLVIDLCRRV